MSIRPSRLVSFVPVIEHLPEAACLESHAAEGPGADPPRAVVNAAWVSLFGGGAVTPLVESTAADAWAPALGVLDGAGAAAGRLETWRSRPAGATRETLTTTDGRTLEWDHSPIHEGGALVAHLWRVRDATHERKLEESVRQAQRLNTVGRLAGGIAHDFNNLLTAVVGYCDLLDTQFDSGDERRLDVHEIRNAAMRASSLTRQLLAFSRRQVMQPEVVDVGMMIGEMPRMLSRLMGEQVRVEIAVPDEPAEVFADPGQVEQAIFSLAANARDAMPDGGTLRVTVTHAQVDAERARSLDMGSGPVVQIVVEDTGEGMDAATRARAFDPFFTTRPLSQGLGLPTVHGIVRQTGGAVVLESSPGEGTRVEILLPRYAEPATVDVPDPSRYAPVPERSGPAVILVVEDEASVLRLVRRVLEGEGMVVLSAQDAEEAGLLASQHGGAIDLLLTDVVMPGANGVELAERMGRERPSTRVLFMSGHADHAVVQRGIIEAGRPFLQKPFAPDRLLSRVRDALA
jgi:two-component system, cell cycle sensor histidine kinase and response regulator CckA